MEEAKKLQIFQDYEAGYKHCVWKKVRHDLGNKYGLIDENGDAVDADAEKVLTILRRKNKDDREIKKIMVGIGGI